MTIQLPLTKFAVIPVATVAILSSAWAQSVPKGQDGVNARNQVVVQFGPGNRKKYTAKVSQKELWEQLRKGDMNGLTEITTIAGLQASLPCDVLLVESNLLKYTAQLKTFTYVVSEVPNSDLMKGFTIGKGQAKPNGQGAPGIDVDLPPDQLLESLKSLKPKETFSALLFDHLEKRLESFQSVKTAIFSAAEWDSILDGTDHGSLVVWFDTDCKNVDKLKGKIDLIPNDNQLKTDILKEWNRYKSELEDIAGLVGCAIGLSPESEYKVALDGEHEATRKAVEEALSYVLVPDLGRVPKDEAFQTGYVVSHQLKNGNVVVATLGVLGFPVEESSHKFYSVNTAGPFFYDLDSFSYDVVKGKDSNNVDTFTLKESGKQSAKKSTIGAFYHQMYMVTDHFHVGISIGVVASDESKIGYGIGLTSRIGGNIFLTWGQLYVPVTEARFPADSVFSTDTEANAAKVANQSSFKWKPFIGLSIKF